MDKTPMDIAQWFATLGVGGVLAGVIFIFYRKDVRQYTELWKNQSDQLMAVVKENTAANTKVGTIVDALHRRMDDEAQQAHLPSKRW